LGSQRKHKIEEDYKLIPHNGVYVVKSIINQKPFWNDEHRVQPTVSGEKTVDRSPFFDFDTDLYDQK
jgi:riboflavin kinase/FMN adenylyltransferase